MAAVRFSLHELFDALAANDEGTVIREIAGALAEHVRPTQIAGRLAIAAAPGDVEGVAIPALAAAGRIGEWMRLIPAGPEPGADRRQQLMPAVPLTAAALFAAPAIARAAQSPAPAAPEPLFPKDVPNAEGSWGALRDAVLAGDAATAGRVIMGFYGSGTDYREIEGAITYAINARFAADGRPLMQTLAATTALDYVEWGDRAPGFLLWLLPFLLAKAEDAPGAADVRTAIGDPLKSLDFARTRLALANAEAAGAALRQAVARGTTADVVSAVFDALKRNASGTQVGAQVAVVAAENLALTPPDSPDDLARNITALRVANAARLTMSYVQDIRVLPVIFQAANFVNQAVHATGDRRAQPRPAPASAPLASGIIESGMLRNLARQVSAGDEVGSLATVKRYTSMGFPARTLAGTLGLAAAQADLRADANGRGLLATQAAGETFTALTLRQQGEAGRALMDAVVRVITSQPGDHTLAQRVEAALGLA